MNLKLIIKKHSDFLRYILVGGFNTVLDIGLFTLLANFFLLNPLISNIISTIIVVSISFFLNYHFVFKSNKSKVKTAPFFIGVTLFNGWIIQSIVIWLVISTLGDVFAHEWINLIAKICGVAVGMICNFLEYRIIFKDKNSKEEDMVK